MRTRLGLTIAVAAFLLLDGPGPSAGPAACRFWPAEDMAAERCCRAGDLLCEEEKSRSRRGAGVP